MRTSLQNHPFALNIEIELNNNVNAISLSGSHAYLFSLRTMRMFAYNLNCVAGLC